MKNKKSIILLSVILSMSSSIFAAEDVLSYRDFLPEIIKRDAALRPYVKTLISRSDLPEKVELFSTIETPESFRALDFKGLLKGMFGEKAWMPPVYQFKDIDLQGLFQPYFYKDPALDAQMIFLANVLYAAGDMLYQQTGNSIHLEHAASIGHADAQFKMFLIAFKAQKQEEAKNYLFCSAAQGYIPALYALSTVFEGYRQIGVPKDLRVAKALCQEAADLGDQEAIFVINVATLTEGTFGSQKNFQQGVRIAKELADGGNTHAQSFLEAIMKSSGDALQE
ncbi:MAG: hypothetical protein WCG04_05690, partial [Alphaproteobacteria bacterium]